MNKHLLTNVLVGTCIVFLFSCQRQQAFFQRSPVYRADSSVNLTPLVLQEQATEPQEWTIAAHQPVLIGEAAESESELLADNSQRIPHTKTTSNHLPLLNQRPVTRAQNVEFASALLTSKKMSFSERQVLKRLSFLPTKRIGSTNGNVGRGIGITLLIIGILLGLIGLAVKDGGVFLAALLIGGIGYLILTISSFASMVQTVL
ncbi:hypothetical protein [Nibrella saemangeumensis]|uniref:hypothetical protein n=1 Tax=Nibrella saemangeumensis TaxID=1084526 RepID=UPI0031F0AA3E